jgi:RNA polymerase sigma factor (sigma-70 family)
MDVSAAAARREEFVALVEAHARIVHKVAYTYCWSADDRADLTQEILAQMWRAFPGYDPARRFSTWMYRVALNVAISWLRDDGRRRRRHEPLDPARHDPVAPPPRDEADDRVRALYVVIDRLAPLDRALLLLYLDEHSAREIGAILGLSDSNVATRISRLKQRLKKRLGDPI